MITPEMLGKSILSRLENNYDCGIVITGWKGTGKSTLAYHLAKGIDKRFDIPRNFIFDPRYEVIRERMHSNGKYYAMIIDEAIRAMYKIDWSNQMQNALVKLLTVSRKENQAYILNIPIFTELRTSFRNNLVNTWIHVYERGRAVVFGRDYSPYTSDVWHIEENNKAWVKNKDRGAILNFSVDDELKMLRSSNNYVGDMEFPVMPPEDEKIYLKTYEDTKKDIDDASEFTGKLKDARNLAVRALRKLHLMGLSRYKIMEISGAAESTLYSWGVFKEDEPEVT